ncbi:MAG TPA: hypothetical protein VF132_08035, partial [Rudaea sp.]
VTAAPSAALAATKTVAGAFHAGGSVTYTIVLHNGGSGAQADNPGDEFVDVLDPALTFSSVAATSGTGSFSGGAVHWNGSIPAGGDVTITIVATVSASAHGTISNQGTVSWDANGDGTNDTSAPTDDPTVAGNADPTTFAVTAAPITVTPAPALQMFGMLLLMLALVGTALKRRKPE